MADTSDFKNGLVLKIDGNLQQIVEFQHVKPGKGGAFVRTKLKRSSDGAVIDKTFRAGEKFRAVRTEVRKLQYLYNDGTDAHFMDNESFDQLSAPFATLEEPLGFVKANTEVEALYIDGEFSDIQLPASVVLEITETEPGVRGDTVSGGGNKPATLETGKIVNVPLFLNTGDAVKVDTRSGDYMSRA